MFKIYVQIAKLSCENTREFFLKMYQVKYVIKNINELIMPTLT
jgi:hypothetical protein